MRLFQRALAVDDSGPFFLASKVVDCASNVKPPFHSRRQASDHDRRFTFLVLCAELATCLQCPRRATIISTFPFSHAKCRVVSPFLSRLPMSILSLQLSSRSLSISTLLCPHATWVNCFPLKSHRSRFPFAQ